MASFFHTFQKFIQAIPGKKYALIGLVMFCGCAFAESKDSDLVAAIVQILNLVFLLITFLMTPAIIMAGWLLSPDWTMGDFFGLRPYFIQIWILVSNMVYIAFALLLLGMAVIQIFGSNSNYAFKKKLPRFLVGILIVPFTWLIVSWTLSFANQAVAAILSIPLGAIDSVQDKPGGKKSLFHLKTIPTEISLDFTKNAPGSIKCGSSGTLQSEKLGTDGSVMGVETVNGSSGAPIECISPARFITKNEAGPFFIIMVYAYDIFKIQETNITTFNSVCSNAQAKDCITQLAQMLQKFGVGLITTFFFGIILIALCWVLLARAFKLWMYIMFSPLFGLAYAVGDEGLGKVHESSGGGGGEGMTLGKLGFMPFFSLAMVPVFVAGVLSFGLLFVGVINTTFTGNLEPGSGANGNALCTKADTFLVQYCIKKTGTTDPTSGADLYNSSVTIGNTEGAKIVFNFGEILSGFVGNSGVQNAGGGAQALAEGGRDIFAHIILSLISLGILWMGIKAAVSSDEVTKMAFEPFKKFGDTVGNFVQQAPSLLPTPHPSFAAFDPATWSAAAKMGNKILQEKESERQNALTDILEGNASRFEEAIEQFKAGTISFQDTLQAWHETHERDPEDAKKIIQTGLEKVKRDELPENQRALFDTFKADIEKARGKGDLKKVLDKTANVPLIATLESDQHKMKGLSSLASDLGATSVGNSGNTNLFSGHRISFDANSDTVGALPVVNNSGKPLAQGNISIPQRNAITDAFKTKQAISVMELPIIKEKLKKLGFSSDSVDRILTLPDGQKVANSLGDAAGLPTNN